MWGPGLAESDAVTFFAVPPVSWLPEDKTTLILSLCYIQGDSDVFSIKQNLNSLHQGEHRFSHAFFTKVPHFRDNRKNVQF